MKPRRPLLFTLSIVLALCAACGWWLHRERQQYALNRQLIAALEKCDFQTALALVNGGADPNTRQSLTSVPTLPQLLQHLLHHTLPANNSPTALILACGADAPTQAKLLNYTSVSAEARLPLLRALLSHSANVNARDNDTGTALDYAVLFRNSRIVELLLGHDADANIPGSWGMTPLMWAAKRGATNNARLLLAHGANPNVQDTAGNTALHYAFFSANAKDVIPVLMAHGADPNLPDKHGRTPLQFIQMHNRPDIVRLLKGGAK